MTILIHEIKQNKKSLIIWTVSIIFLLEICILMFPEMQNEMSGVNDIFSSMGAFTQAFGMDKLNFGTFSGFYAIECGNILGLGGAFFSSLIAISSLSKEERDHTADFLLSHPVNRSRIVTEKLASIFIQILVMNVLAYITVIISAALIGESFSFKEIILLHLAYLFMQIEIACICFCISSFIRRGSLGIGLGIAAFMYFINIISNISDKINFFKYITPFGYTEGSDIIASQGLDWKLIALGGLYSLIFIITSYIKYITKDIK